MRGSRRPAVGLVVFQVMMLTLVTVLIGRSAVVSFKALPDNTEKDSLLSLDHTKTSRDVQRYNNSNNNMLKMSDPFVYQPDTRFIDTNLDGTQKLHDQLQTKQTEATNQSRPLGIGNQSPAKTGIATGLDGKSSAVHLLQTKPTEGETSQALRMVAGNASDQLTNKSNAAVVYENRKVRRNMRQNVFAGIVRNARDVQINTWKTLAELSCQYNVSVYVTVGKIGKNEKPLFKEPFCAPIRLELQETILPKNMTLPNNRVARLMMIRYAQRNRIQQLHFSPKNFEDRDAYENSVVIIADLDLIRIPRANELMERVELISTKNHKQSSPHAICASGKLYADEVDVVGAFRCKKRVKVLNEDKLKYTYKTIMKKDCLEKTKRKRKVFTEAYYDTFATVLLPDSFAYPLHLRMLRKYYPDEDPEISQMRPVTLTAHLQSLAQQHPLGMAPVRSCFSGLALYRASIWLTPRCQYSLDRSDNKQYINYPWKGDHKKIDILRYASKYFKLPCEHVVFHDCLHRRVFPRTSATPEEGHTANTTSADIVVDPNLVTYW